MSIERWPDGFAVSMGERWVRKSAPFLGEFRIIVADFEENELELETTRYNGLRSNWTGSVQELTEQFNKVIT
jgi:hypothetical protein